MSVLLTCPTARRWRPARTWVTHLAVNTAGFAAAYVLLSAVLWALGDRVLVPLVPRAGASYRVGDGVMYTQQYVSTVAWVMGVPSVIFALALTGFALWRRRPWYVPGVLLGLLLGDLRDYNAVWSMQSCGGAWRLAPHAAVLLANGVGLVVAARPAASIAGGKEMLMPFSRRSRRAHSPRAAVLVALLALASASLAGCENTAGHHVGDTISNAEVRITLTSVAVVPADATFQPAPGDELVRVHVRYTNRRRTVLSFNEVQFAVQNGAAAGDCGGVQQADCSVPRAGTYFRYGEQGFAGYQLQPGATVESDILFEVGKGAHDARLVYQPDGIQDIANFWWLLGL